MTHRIHKNAIAEEKKNISLYSSRFLAKRQVSKRKMKV